jgi:hypothetical protein
MARKHGSKTETVRKLSKTGAYTYYVTIPKGHIDVLGWRERQRLTVKLSGKTVVVADWKPKKKK